jgi:flagellar motor protein MotB
MAILALAVTVGCRSGSGGSVWPWQQSTAPPTALGSTPPAPQSPGLARIGDLFRREDEQSRLAEEQRRALAQLADWQRSQQQQLDVLAQQKRGEQTEQVQRQLAQLENQQRELEQLAEVRRRALELDTNNRELNTQLAQMQKQNRLLEDQMVLMRQQLNDAANQLAGSLQARQDTEQRFMQVQQDAQKRIDTMQATLPQSSGAVIRANSSLQRNLSAISIAGLNVRQDGDVIRVELPSDRLFSPGTASLNNEAMGILDQAASAIKQNYPRQMFGIEAHADNAPIQNGSWGSTHQLTAAQAMAVFDQLTQRHGFDARQIFVLGHGANYPLASNATPAGQQRNRRVEIVIYPEVFGQG